MYTSRCGVRCDLCERREKGICKGCTHMLKPFWGGVCEVKSCVETKKLDHCGQCSDFPCDVLSHMGIEQGFDPQVKITQCQRWLTEEREMEYGDRKKE